MKRLAVISNSKTIASTFYKSHLAWRKNSGFFFGEISAVLGLAAGHLAFKLVSQGVNGKLYEIVPVVCKTTAIPVSQAQVVPAFGSALHEVVSA